MNKKFSTLLAGMLLTTAFSVNAQEGNPTTTPLEPAIPSAIVKSIPGLAKMTAVESLKEGVNAELYQLKVGDKVLAMNDEGGLYLVSATSLTASNMANTLWCATVSTQEEGQAPKFDFENRATGMILDIATDALSKANDGVPVDAVVGGSLSGWAFSRSYKKMESKPLFSYMDSENIVGFKVASDGTVQVVKVKAADYNRDENSYKGTTSYFAVFELNSPAQIYLTAKELNTIFGTYTDAKHGIKLGFNKDVLGTDIPNPFNAQSFYAQEANYVLTADNQVAPYLYVRQKDNEKYLRVDTAYTNESGVPFLAYKWNSDWKDVDPNGTEKDFGSASAYLKGSELKDQYKFLFVYSPKNDNVEIYIHTVTNKEEEKYWYQSADKGYNYRVSLQDLIKDRARILTVDKDKQNTTITLGYASCGAVTPTRTSVADNVYFIRNAKGQYLASPIYNNGASIEWVTVNEKQDVNHMPAFQWVALKTNVSDKNNVSPVTFTNREFSDLKLESVQLHKDAEKSTYYVTKAISNANIVAEEALTITSVAGEFISDKYLGYKKLTAEELTVNKFTFNYYHPYSSDKYIAKSAKDSTLSVLEDKSAFNLDTVVIADKKKTADEAYGFTVNKEIQKRIPNLAQLYRTVYLVTLGDKKLAINKEDKFNVSDYWKANRDDNQEAGALFFKENNCIDGVHYYAILSTEHQNNGLHEIAADDKAGVSDYDPNATLKSQVLNETRTSAFAIAPDNTPLYRRFNSAVLEGNEGDAADTLRFIEKYRKEYLQVEANKNFMKEGIDFLGIYTQDKTTDGLSFIVDTAWVNRGAGNIKPQYLISINRNDFAGTEGIPCTYEHNHYDNAGNKVDAAHCSHATPAIAGFQRGKYLINFHDFAIKHNEANTLDAKKDATYMWKKYDRAGFVDAIRVADTLFILRDEFKNLKNEEITLAALNKAEEEALAAAQKAGVDKKNFVSYKYVLSGDEHKYVTWSMRFIDKNVAANEVEDDRAFLFESMNHDGVAVAPTKAAWLKMQNGCLVLSDASSSFNEQTTGGDDALIFNVEQGDDIATDNETIESAEASVAVSTGNGTVTVQGAAGKKVVITNVLGKVIASTVLTSDNATFNAPAGVVAVAVEGEEAVKAVVK